MKVSRIKVRELATWISDRQKNKYDCIVAICGERGVGKSTCAIRLARSARKLQHAKFNIRNDIVYTREALMKSLEGYDGWIIADEMINAAFKRDFYATEQKDLIKMLNMYRDHRNILLMCIPNFWDLDKPLRDLVKIRIDVLRRGLGVLHFPVKSFYTNDQWDSKYNQKIEEGWSKSYTKKPKHHRLSTFKGFIRIKELFPKTEEMYQRIKNEKRNNILASQILPKEKEKNYYKKAAELIIAGKLKEDDIEKFAAMNEVDAPTFMRKVTKVIREDLKITETANQLIQRNKKATKVMQMVDRFGFPVHVTVPAQ